MRLRAAAVTASVVLALGALAACGHDDPAPAPTTTAPTARPTVTTARPTTISPTTPVPTASATIGGAGGISGGPTGE